MLNLIILINKVVPYQLFAYFFYAVVESHTAMVRFTRTFHSLFNSWQFAIFSISLILIFASVVSCKINFLLLSIHFVDYFVSLNDDITRVIFLTFQYFTVFMFKQVINTIKQQLPTLLLVDQQFSHLIYYIGKLSDVCLTWLLLVLHALSCADTNRITHSSAVLSAYNFYHFLILRFEISHKMSSFVNLIIL